MEHTQEVLRVCVDILLRFCFFGILASFVKGYKMTVLEMEYLEHGKFFRNNQVPSDFYDLAYTAGTSRFSKDLRDAVGLDLKSSFSENPGKVSFAFIPVLGRSRYAFVQFQSRFENEFHGSNTNRPFFQTKFLMCDVASWRFLYEGGLSVMPSLVQRQKSTNNLLDNFSSVVGSIGKSKAVTILDSNINNSLFFQYSREFNKEMLSWVSAIANAVFEYKETGGVSVQHNALLSDYDKLVLIDAVMHVLLPVVQEPISFALDPASTVKVNLRFGGNVQNRGAAYNLDLSNSTWSQTENDINELVGIFAENIDRWDEQHKKIYSGFSKVVSLREKRKEKDSLLFLLALLKGKYSKLFQNTNGGYDDEIVHLMSSADYKDILKNGSEDIRIRLLNFPSIQKLDTSSWFGLLHIASLGSTRLKNVLSQYIEKDTVRLDDICVYFGKLSKEKMVLFTIDEDQNILYDLIKKFFQKRMASSRQSVFANDGGNEKTLQKLDVTRHVLDGIKNLPQGYDQADEMWSWVGLSIVNMYDQGNTISDCFSQLKLDVSDYPYLFYKALLAMRISLDEINKADVRWINTFAKRGMPEFLLIKKSLTSKPQLAKEHRENSQYTSMSEPAESTEEYEETSRKFSGSLNPNSVNILEQARREQETRQQGYTLVNGALSQKKKDKPIILRQRALQESQTLSQNDDKAVKNVSLSDVERHEDETPVNIWSLVLFFVMACLLLIIFLKIAVLLYHPHRFGWP